MLKVVVKNENKPFNVQKRSHFVHLNGQNEVEIKTYYIFINILKNSDTSESKSGIFALFSISFTF